MSFDPRGWVPVQMSDDLTVYAHLAAKDGHAVITDLHISGPDITADTLRTIHPGRIVAAVAAAVFDEQHVTIGRTDRFFARLVSMLKMSDEDMTLGELRSLPRRVWEARKPQPLERPDGTDPDTFYAQVADAYRSAAAETNKPAVLIAEESNVPVDTARSWVKEARRRGFLEPGRKGRAQ